MNDSVEVKQFRRSKGLSVRMYGTKKWRPIYTKNGSISLQFDKDLKKALGFNRDEIIKKNEEKNSSDQTKIEELNNTLLDTSISDDVRERTENEIISLEDGIAEREQENETIQERMSLRERIKAMFKKYGVTLTAVVTAVGVVIGVIVSNLSSGLANMASGVGKGLKDIGAKLANILPGMVGAIASFIFKTAGEVVGFLAKNAWLLIVAVVISFIEEFKKKKR